MALLIGKHFRIVSDERNVTLEELHIARAGPRTKVVGRENWKPIRYYSNLKNALDGLIDLEINRTGMKSLEMIVAKIEELRRAILQGLADQSRTCKDAIGDSNTKESIGGSHA